MIPTMKNKSNTQEGRVELCIKTLQKNSKLLMKQILKAHV